MRERDGLARSLLRLGCAPPSRKHWRTRPVLQIIRQTEQERTRQKRRDGDLSSMILCLGSLAVASHSFVSSVMPICNVRLSACLFIRFSMLSSVLPVLVWPLIS